MQPYKEDARLNPTNPYSATEAAADSLCLSYFNTYGLPIIITRTENNYGPFQHRQKAIPTFVRKALAGEDLPVYGDGHHKRMWLHVEDHCRAILLAQGGSKYLLMQQHVDHFGADTFVHLGPPSLSCVFDPFYIALARRLSHSGFADHFKKKPLT